MKALIFTSILITSLTAFSFGKPINDIYSIKEPILTEESYVNDIPFNTWAIAVEAIFEGDDVKLTEEPYINDIPFDTREIACKTLLMKMLETSGEINIDDIPFNTEKVYCEHLASVLTTQYKNEKNTYDLPAEPDFIICSYDKGITSCVAVKVNNPKKGHLNQKKLKKSDYTILYPVKMEFSGLDEKAYHRSQQVPYLPGFSL